MSIRILERVWRGSRAKNGARLVLLALADFADDAGRSYPSRGAIASKANLSARPVDYALRWLVENGELRIEPNAGPVGCNVYHVLVAPPVESAPPVDLAETPRRISAPPP